MWARTTLAAGGVLLIAASLSFGSSLKHAGVRHGEILCGSSGASEVVRLDPETGDKHVLSDDPLFEDPSDSAFLNGKLYVADYEAFGGGGGVLKVNPKTGDTSMVSDDDAMKDALGVVVPKSGKPIVSSYFGPWIASVNPKTGKQHTIAKKSDGLKGEGGIALADGKIYIAEGDFLQSVDLKTGKVKKVVDPFVSDSYGMTADSKGRISTRPPAATSSAPTRRTSMSTRSAQAFRSARASSTRSSTAGL